MSAQKALFSKIDNKDQRTLLYFLKSMKNDPDFHLTNPGDIKMTLASFQKLMIMYQCANMEIETKLHVLNAEFSYHNDRNPFESIKSRVKTPQSIIEKMQRKNIPFSIENMEKNLFDIAGVRVICSFPSDIYTVRDMLVKQDDIKLIQEKDYIRKPKENGYRSLHLIVEVPIFLAEEKRPMKVEIQLRTIAMDFWASLEHKLKYKKTIPNAEEMAVKLKACAEASAALDLEMQAIQEEIGNAPENED